MRMRDKSFLGLCQFCDQIKENDQLKKSLKCGHLVCLDCSNVKNGNCPILNCDPPPLKTKQFLPQDLIFLWEKAPSTDPIPNVDCREAISSSVMKKPMDSRRDKLPKQVDSCVKNSPPPVIASSMSKDEWLSSASAANVDDCVACNEWLLTDDYDSDAGPRSPGTCRKSKWFENFDRELEFASNQGETSDPARQWCCPACQGRSCASRWYQGLQRLAQHAKRKHSTRVRLHLELAQLIEDRLKTEAVASDPVAKPCHKWKGLKEDKRDHEIVWPPMVAISYTMRKMYENTQLIGMTNQEVMDMFSSYDAIVKTRQCYYIDGYCGMSILVFDSSVMGYLEAKRLHKDFENQGTGRNAWHSQSVRNLSSRDQQVYGYLALKEDVDTFNSHKPAKHQLKYEMRSYQEMVANKIKQMCVVNHRLAWLRSEVNKQENKAKELKKKLLIAKNESKIMRREVTKQHQQHEEEVEYQEQFYKEQIKNILESMMEFWRKHTRLKMKKMGNSYPMECLEDSSHNSN